MDCSPNLKRHNQHFHRLELQRFFLNFGLRIHQLKERYEGRDLISDMHTCAQ